MKNRLLIGLPLVAGVWYLLLHHQDLANIFTALLILRALWEFYTMNSLKGKRPFTGLGMGLAAWCYFDLLGDNPAPLELQICLGVLCLFIRQAMQQEARDGLARMGLTLFGWAYIVHSGIYFFKLQRLDFVGGAEPVCVLIALIFACKFGDATAYFGGSRWGKNKLIPRLSPNKTWEGSAFGIAGSLLPAFYLWSQGLPLFASFFVCLIVGLASLAGDLAESMLKRELQIKDASNDIPGFGGILDIFDALIFALPAAYWMILWTGVATAVSKS